jgi:hypothetical protein
VAREGDVPAESPIVSTNWRFRSVMGAGALAGNGCPVEEEDAVGGMVVS